MNCLNRIVSNVFQCLFSCWLTIGSIQSEIFDLFGHQSCQCLCCESRRQKALSFIYCGKLPLFTIQSKIFDKIATNHVSDWVTLCHNSFKPNFLQQNNNHKKNELFSLRRKFAYDHHTGKFVFRTPKFYAIAVLLKICYASR